MVIFLNSKEKVIIPNYEVQLKETFASLPIPRKIRNDYSQPTWNSFTEIDISKF
jgi:hypothetical protein